MFNVYSNLSINYYNNVLFQSVNFNISSNSNFILMDNNNIIFSGYPADFNMYDSSQFSVIYAKKIHIEDVNFTMNMTGYEQTVFALNADIIEFFSYDGVQNRGLTFNNVSTGVVVASQVSLNDAKVFVSDNAFLEFYTDKLIVAAGGRFTVSMYGKMTVGNATGDGSLFSDANMAFWPKGLFYFKKYNNFNKGWFLLNGCTSGKELDSLLSYNLISVDGNTDEAYLRSVLSFQDSNKGGGTSLQISLK